MHKTTQCSNNSHFVSFSTYRSLVENKANLKGVDDVTAGYKFLFSTKVLEMVT